MLKCGAGEEWGRSFGPIVCKMKLRGAKEERNIVCTIKRRKAN